MIWLLPWEPRDDVRHRPWCTWTLIVLNVIACFVMYAGLDDEIERWVLRYGLVSGDWHWWQFLTANFMHGGWMHLIVNMLFLWVFGDDVEDALGRIGFLVVYFAGGFAGDLLYVVANDEMVPSIGASGCISAVAGAYGVLFFNRQIGMKVMLLFAPVHTIHARAFWAVLVFFGIDVALTVWHRGALLGGGGINYVAHGAGWMFGFAVAIAARIYGVMHRYHRVGNGGGWWGYWPVDLEHRARLAEVNKRKREEGGGLLRRISRRSQSHGPR